MTKSESFNPYNLKLLDYTTTYENKWLPGPESCDDGARVQTHLPPANVVSRSFSNAPVNFLFDDLQLQIVLNLTVCVNSHE